VVLDTLGLLALVNAEPGADVVAAALVEAAISAVNLAEVVTKLIDVGVPPAAARSETASLVRVVDLDSESANATARLRAAARWAGLSLGDRDCLALGEILGQPVLTADRAWQVLSIGIEIRLIR
jgi:ribonuclease VapC